MPNLRNVLDTQQRINEAAKAIMDYFGNEMPYYVHLEQMLSAQTQIIGLMELVKMHMISNPDDELDFQTDEITLFLRDVHNYLRMLKPFIVLTDRKHFFADDTPQKGGNA